MLCHPDSEGLEEHCRQELDQKLGVMRQKVVRNTRTFLDLCGSKCEIRWHLDRPVFHVIANEKELHFGCYPAAKRGHFARRYIVANETELYSTFLRWFAQNWENATDARREIRYIESGIYRNRAIFLDRDGTLIEDVGYITPLEASDVRIMPGVVEGLKELSRRGFRLIVVSNQQAVGLDLTEKRALAEFTKALKNRFGEEGIAFDAIYYCPHRKEEDCECRKPRQLLFERAAKRFNLDLAKCHFISDSAADLDVKRYIPAITVHMVQSQSTLADIARGIL